MASTKTICKAANELGLEIYLIRYKPVGYGYDIVWNDHGHKWILASLEPVFYNNGDRWVFFPKARRAGGVSYYKRLSQCVKRMQELKKEPSYTILAVNAEPINRPELVKE